MQCQLFTLWLDREKYYKRYRAISLVGVFYAYFLGEKKKRKIEYIFLQSTGMRAHPVFERARLFIKRSQLQRSRYTRKQPPFAPRRFDTGRAQTLLQSTECLSNLNYPVGALSPLSLDVYYPR